MEYMSVKEAAGKWQVSERRVHQYCKDHRIPGLKRLGRSWAIPADAGKPADPRRAAKNPEMALKIGAVIAAAGRFGGETGISPLMAPGGESLIRRMVLIFQQARVSPIVVITGYQALEVEHNLSDYGVIFIRNENYEHSDKLESAKLGLSFLQDKCDKVFFASLSIPMYTSDTLCRMVSKNAEIVVPTYRQKRGHPVLLDTCLIPDILNYEGQGGMQKAMKAGGGKVTYLEVEDEGILLSAEHAVRMDDLVAEHNDRLLHPFVRLSIEKERAFFDGRAKLLLYLIQETHSVQNACKRMAISRGKAWDMIRQMERELGFTVVRRKQGGKRGRKTELTEKGQRFLQFYLDYEDAVKSYAAEQFEVRFTEFMSGESR